jgi:hypothetical protein
VQEREREEWEEAEQKAKIAQENAEKAATDVEWEEVQRVARDADELVRTHPLHHFCVP